MSSLAIFSLVKMISNSEGMNHRGFDALLEFKVFVPHEEPELCCRSLLRHARLKSSDGIYAACMGSTTRAFPVTPGVTAPLHGDAFLPPAPGVSAQGLRCSVAA